MFATCAHSASTRRASAALVRLQSCKRLWFVWCVGHRVARIWLWTALGMVSERVRVRGGGLHAAPVIRAGTREQRLCPRRALVDDDSRRFRRCVVEQRGHCKVVLHRLLFTTAAAVLQCTACRSTLSRSRTVKLTRQESALLCSMWLLFGCANVLSCTMGNDGAALTRCSKPVPLAAA